LGSVCGGLRRGFPPRHLSAKKKQTPIDDFRSAAVTLAASLKLTRELESKK
jgi:hypothetical protein